MVSRPPSGMASRALTTRFMITCSSWLGSAFTLPRSGRGTKTSCIVSPSSRWSMACIPSTMPLRSSTLGASTCLRLKARSWRVSAAACWEASRIPSTFRRSGWSSGIFRRMRSLSPWITMRRLLKSWAMPPASWPTASIFWAWRSWSSLSRSATSARFRSVRSTVRPRSWRGRPPLSRSTWMMSRSHKTRPSAATARYSNSWSVAVATAARHCAIARSRSSLWMRRAKKSGSRSQWSVGKPRKPSARWLTKVKRRRDRVGLPHDGVQALHEIAEALLGGAARGVQALLLGEVLDGEEEARFLLLGDAEAGDGDAHGPALAPRGQVQVEGDVVLRHPRLEHLADAAQEAVGVGHLVEAAADHVAALQREGLEERPVGGQDAQVARQHEEAGRHARHDLLGVALQVEDGALLPDLVAQELGALALPPEADEEGALGEDEEDRGGGGEIARLAEVLQRLLAVDLEHEAPGRPGDPAGGREHGSAAIVRDLARTCPSSPPRRAPCAASCSSERPAAAQPAPAARNGEM